MYFRSSSTPATMNQLSTLSPQEKKVLIALSYGSLYKEIAQECNISVNTVKKHLKNVYRKLHVNKRSKAVEKLFEPAGPEMNAGQS